MANEITIRLKMDLETGKKDITIELDSDADMLPYEHEQKHREIVEQLLGQGILEPDDVGKVNVERVQEPPKASEEKEEQPQEERKMQEEPG